jgi:uncharacterized membrane protein
MSTLPLTPEALKELPARSSLPWVWFGFFFVVAFIIEETLIVVLEMDPAIGELVSVLIALAGYIFWLFCVSRFHTILCQISRNHYPISGAVAAGKHLIPFYNLYWIFHWPATMSDYLNRRERVRMVSGYLLGVFLLISLLTSRFFDAGIGLAGMFTVGMYISAKLRRHIESIKGVSPGMMPPPPDPNWFSEKPSEDKQSTLPAGATTAYGARVINREAK